MYGEPYTKEIDDKIKELVRKGYTNKAIGTILKRSADSINHRKRVLFKN